MSEGPDRRTFLEAGACAVLADLISYDATARSPAAGEDGAATSSLSRTGTASPVRRRERGAARRSSPGHGDPRDERIEMSRRGSPRSCALVLGALDEFTFLGPGVTGIARAKK